MGGNGDHLPGGGRMNRKHSSPSTGQRLSAQYMLPFGDAQFPLCADMLFERHNEALREGNLAQRRAV